MNEERRQQIPFRLHPNDYKVMKDKLLDEDIGGFQGFVTALVQAYLDDDSGIQKILEKWKLSRLKHRRRDKNFSFSSRERRELLNRLEEMDNSLEKTGDDI